MESVKPIIIETESCFTTIVCPSAATPNVVVEFYTSYKQLPPAWDLILPPNSRLLSHNIGYFEDSNIKDLNYYYGLVTVGGTLVGVIYLQRLAINNTHYPNFSSNGIVARNVYNTIAKRTYGLLVAGNLFCTGFPAYWFNSQAVEPAIFYKALKQTLNKMVSTTKSHGVMIKDVDAHLNTVLQKNNWGFAHMGDDIFMQMELQPHWHTFEDYTKSLSKKYAARVRKMLQVRAPLTIRQLSIAEIEQHLPAIEALYQDVASHSSVKMGVLNATYFLNMQKTLGNKFEVWGWFKDNEMLAFTTAVMENGSYEVYYIGYAEDNNRQYGIYPNILLHGVERAIQLNKTLKLGRTALEAKAIIGCKPVYLNNYIKLKSKPLQLGLKYMLKTFVAERGNEWKKRSPFK